MFSVTRGYRDDAFLCAVQLEQGGVLDDPRQAGLRPALSLVALSALVMLVLAQAGPIAAAGESANATYWNVRKFPQPQPACTGAFLNAQATYFDRLDCGVGRVRLSSTDATATVTVDFVAENGAVVDTRPATYVAASQYWEYSIRPAATWPAGEITMRAKVGGASTAGSGQIFFQQLGASVSAVTRPEGYRPGDAVPVAGRIYEQKSVGLDTVKTNVPATYSLQVLTPAGEVRGPYGPFTADRAATASSRGRSRGRDAGLTATAGPIRAAIEVEVVNASYDDPVTGTWRRTAPGGALPLASRRAGSAREQLRLGRRLGEARRDVSVPRLRPELHGEPPRAARR